MIINDQGVTSQHPFSEMPSRFCVFEYIYFARPDSIIENRDVMPCARISAELHESGVDADIVVPVPDYVPAASAMLMRSACPSSWGLSAIIMSAEPSFRPIPAARPASSSSTMPICIRQVSIILVDDPIVRGTTSMKIVSMMRSAGAREVHMRTPVHRQQIPVFMVLIPRPGQADCRADGYRCHRQSDRCRQPCLYQHRRSLPCAWLWQRP